MSGSVSVGISMNSIRRRWREGRVSHHERALSNLVGTQSEVPYDMSCWGAHPRNIAWWRRIGCDMSYAISVLAQYVDGISTNRGGVRIRSEFKDTNLPRKNGNEPNLIHSICTLKAKSISAVVYSPAVVTVNPGSMTRLPVCDSVQRFAGSFNSAPSITTPYDCLGSVLDWKMHNT
jgi:hypothetical protein